MNLSILEQVRGIAADVLGVSPEQITPYSSPESIEGWDSILHLNLIMAVEQEFDLQFEPEEMDEMKNIQGITAVLNDKLRRLG